MASAAGQRPKTIFASAVVTRRSELAYFQPLIPLDLLAELDPPPPNAARGLEPENQGCVERLELNDFRELD